MTFFSTFYRSLNFLGASLLGTNEYGNRFGLPELLDALCIPEVLTAKIMAQRVSELMVKPMTHEPQVSKLLAKQRGNVFVDVGAWIGYYPLLLHRNFREILALEPDPRNFAVLSQLKQSEHLHNVTILPLALSNKQGFAKLYVSHFLPIHGESSLLRNGARIKGSGEVKRLKGGYLLVATNTLDNLLSQHDFVDVVKVDTEGNEWEVLEGAKNVMSKVNAWLIELHDFYRRRQLDELMISHGYNVSWVTERHGYYSR